MIWFWKFFDWIFPAPKPPALYHLSGYKRDGWTPVQAMGMTPAQTIAIYKSLGGDLEKATWV